MKKYLSKIIAQDERSLQMISALCSEAKVKAEEIRYLPKNSIFLLFLKRLSVETENKNLSINSILKFDFINSCRSKNINISNKDLELQLLNINIYKNKEQFEISLIFDKNRIIELKSEIIECNLEDQNQSNAI
ncbi:MAG: DUF2948 family protein [Pelagibacterales bacterium]|nr:DUF2948 family protein [Pelagibacterales bacterium]